MLANNALAELEMQDGTVLRFTDMWTWELVTGTMPKLPKVNIDERYNDWPEYVDKVVKQFNPKRVRMVEPSEPPGNLGKDFVY